MKKVFIVAHVINRMINDNWDVCEHESHQIEVWNQDEFESELEALEGIQKIFDANKNVRNLDLTVLTVFRRK